MHYPIQIEEKDREIVLTQLQNVITAANGSEEDWAYNRNTSITQKSIKKISVNKELYRNQYRFYEYNNSNALDKVIDKTKAIIENKSAQSTGVVNSVQQNTPQNVKVADSHIHNAHERNDAKQFSCYDGNTSKFIINQVNTGFLGNDGRKYNSCGRSIPLLTQLYKLQDQLRWCSVVDKIACSDSTIEYSANKSQINENVECLICEYDILSVFCAACHEDEMYGTVSSVALHALITFVNEPCAFITYAGLQLCVWTAMTCKSEMADIASHELFVSRMLNLYTSVVSHELCSTHLSLLSEALYVNILRRMLAVILRPNLSPLLKQAAERSMHIVIRALLKRVNNLPKKWETASLHKVMTGAYIIRLASALILGDIKAANDDARICMRAWKMEISESTSVEQERELHHKESESDIDVQWPSASIVCEDIVAAQIEGLSMAHHIILTMQSLFPFSTLSSQVVYCIQNNLCRSLLMSAVALRNTSELFLLSQVLRTMHVVIGYARCALVPHIYAFLQTVHVQPLIHITQTLALHQAYQNNRDDVENVIGPVTNMAVRLPCVEWNVNNGFSGNNYNYRSNKIINSDVSQLSKSLTSNIPTQPDIKNVNYNNMSTKVKGEPFSSSATTGVNQVQNSHKIDHDDGNVLQNEFVISSNYNLPLNTCVEPGSPIVCSSPTYVYSASSKSVINRHRGYDRSNSNRNNNQEVIINNNNNKKIKDNNNNYKQHVSNVNINSYSNINMSNYTFTHKTSYQLQCMREEREVLLESLANLCSDVSFLEWCYTRYDLSWRYSSILPQLWSLLSTIAFDNKVVVSTVINGIANVNSATQHSLSLLTQQNEFQEHLESLQANKLSKAQQCKAGTNKNNNTNNNNNININNNYNIHDATTNNKHINKSSAVPEQVAKLFANTKNKWPHGAQIILYSSINNASNDEFVNTTYTTETNEGSNNNDIKYNDCNAQQDMPANRNAIGSSSYTNNYTGENTNAMEYNCHLVGKEKLSQVQSMALSMLACLQNNIYKLIHYTSLHTPPLTTNTTVIAIATENKESMINANEIEETCIVQTIEQLKQEKEELAEFAVRFHQSAEDNGVPFLLRYAHRVQCLANESERDVLEKNANEYKSQLLLLEPAGAREIGACLFRLSGVLNKRILGEYIGELGKEDDTKEDKAKSSSEQMNVTENSTGSTSTNTNLPSYGSKLFHQLLLLGFMQQFRFADKPLLTAIRELVYKVCLPGESQKIDRVMEAAAQQWYAANQNKSKEINPFQSEEGAFILSFAIIMLNTDLHSGKLKQCMTKDEFTRMNRGIDAGADVPESYLNLLYDDVKEHEIVMADMTERSFGNDVTWDLQMNTVKHASNVSEHLYANVSSAKNNSLVACKEREEIRSSIINSDIECNIINNINNNSNNDAIILHQMLSSDMSTYSLPVYIYMYFVSSQQLADIPARGSNLIEAVEKLAEEMPHMYKIFECALNSLATLVKLASVRKTPTRKQIHKDHNGSDSMPSVSSVHHGDDGDDDLSNNEIIAHTAFCTLLSGAVVDLTKIDRAINMIYESLPCILTVRVILQLIPYLSTRCYFTWQLLAKLVSSLYVQGVLTLSTKYTFSIKSSNTNNKNDDIAKKYIDAKEASASSTYCDTIFNDSLSQIANPRLSRLTIPLINEKTNSEDETFKKQPQQSLQKEQEWQEEEEKKEEIINNSTKDNNSQRVNTDVKNSNSTLHHTPTNTSHNIDQQTGLVNGDSSHEANANNSNTNNNNSGGSNWLTALWSNVTAAAAAAASEGQRKQEIVLCNAQRRTEQALPDIHELIELIASTQLTPEAQVLFICALCEETHMKAKTSAEAIYASYKLSLLCAMVCELIHQHNTFDEISKNNLQQSNTKTLMEHTIINANIDNAERKYISIHRSSMMFVILEQLHKVITHNCAIVFNVLQTPREHSLEAAKSRVIISNDAYRRWSEVAVRIVQSTLTVTNALTHMMEQSETTVVINIIRNFVDMLLSYAKLPLLSHVLLPSLVFFSYVWINESLTYHQNKRCFIKEDDNNIFSNDDGSNGKDNGDNDRLCTVDANLSNVLISIATEVCMCVNTSNISFESLSQLQTILCLLAKDVCIHDIQSATRIISAAFHTGVIALSSSTYVEEHLIEKPTRQTEKTTQATQNYVENGANQVHKCTSHMEHVNANEIIMQCLENYSSNSIDSEARVHVSDSESTIDNSSYLYLLSLKAFAKLIMHTCNANANESLLCFQRTLLDVRRMPLTAFVLEKMYNEVLIPLTRYMCVNAALHNSSFNYNVEYKREGKHALQNEQHYENKNSKSESNENVYNDNKEKIDNNSGWGSNTARSMLFSFFQTLAPSPHSTEHPSAQKAEVVKVQRTNTSFDDVNSSSNDNSSVKTAAANANTNKNVDSNKMITHSEMLTKSNDNMELLGDMELDLTEYSKRIIRNTNTVANKSTNTVNNNSTTTCANIDVKCRIVNLLAKPFLHHFTILLTREPEMLLTLWEQMLVTLRLVYLSHDCSCTSVMEENSENKEQRKQREENIELAKSAERTELESSVVNDDVEGNMLVCEAVEEVVKNAIYVVTATLLSPSTLSPSSPSEEREQQADVTANELLECNSNDKQTSSESEIKKQFCCLTKQLLVELPFATPLLTHIDALYRQNDNESKNGEFDSNKEVSHRNDVNEKIVLDNNYQSTHDDVNHYNNNNQLSISKGDNAQNNDMVEAKEEVEIIEQLTQ